MALEEITIHLARCEEKAGHLERAISYLEMAMKVSPHPEELDRQIQALKQKLH